MSLILASFTSVLVAYASIPDDTILSDLTEISPLDQLNLLDSHNGTAADSLGSSALTGVNHAIHLEEKISLHLGISVKKHHHLELLEGITVHEKTSVLNIFKISLAEKIDFADYTIYDGTQDITILLHDKMTLVDTVTKHLVIALHEIIALDASSDATRNISIQIHDEILVYDSMTKQPNLELSNMLVIYDEQIGQKNTHDKPDYTSGISVDASERLDTTNKMPQNTESYPTVSSSGGGSGASRAGSMPGQSPNVLHGELFLGMWLDAEINDATFLASFGIKHNGSLEPWIRNVIGWYANEDISYNEIKNMLEYVYSK